MPYGHFQEHPLRAFLGDLDALDWAIERVPALRENGTSLEDLAQECDVVFSRMNPKSENDPMEAARQLLSFCTIDDEAWHAFLRYTYALLSDSPSDHGPSI